MSTELVPVQQAAAQPGTMSGSGPEFLTFRVGTEEYRHRHPAGAGDPLYEVPRGSRTRRTSRQGVVNLRGVIVPIVDMRLKLNSEQCGTNTFTVVIVLRLAAGRKVGMVVDAVSDVLAITPRPDPHLARPHLRHQSRASWDWAASATARWILPEHRTP